jgi:tetratricopeptide (TPR) repeat protein
MLRVVREYAAARLEASPETERAVREAHARYFSDLALRLKDEIRGSGRDGALANLELELGNLRTAWRFWLDRRDVEQLLLLIGGFWTLHEAKGWYHGAIELDRDLLAVLEQSGRSSEFGDQEFTIRTSLARALMAVGGYNAEVERAFTRALELARTGGTAAEEIPVLRALASIYNQRTSWDAAIGIGRQLVALGEQSGNQSVLAEGHYVLGVNTLFTDPRGAIGELDQAIALFGPRGADEERFRLGPNTEVLARTASALMLWESGALGRAIQRMDEALRIARTIDHPYSLAYALYHCGFLAINRGRFEECLDFAHELADVSATNDYAVWATLARVLEGVSMAGLGRADDGLVMTEAAVELYQGLTPPPAFWPFVLTLRAAVYAMNGQPGRATELLDEAIAAVTSLGVDFPALRIMKADVMQHLAGADMESVEALYRGAFRTARENGLELQALNAATGLVSLRRQLGRTPDGHEELAAVYRTFTDGHGERALIAAAQLLEGDATPPVPSAGH